MLHSLIYYTFNFNLQPEVFYVNRSLVIKIRIACTHAAMRWLEISQFTVSAFVGNDNVFSLISLVDFVTNAAPAAIKGPFQFSAVLIDFQAAHRICRAEV